MPYRLPDPSQLAGADSLSPGATPEEKFPSSSHLKWIVTTLLVYFGLRLLYFAVSISPDVPPDEVTHYGISVFSKYLLLPVNSPESFQFGLVTNIPWIYYWVMGKLLHLNFFGIPDLVYLRLLNIPFAFGTIYFVWRTLRLLTDDRLTQALLLVAMTNTLMFSFLSASVSSDNLVNLFAAMSIFYMFAFFKNRTGDLLVISLLSLMAGSLTKITFLPLALILGILLAVREFRNIRTLPSALKGYVQKSGMRGAVLAAVFCFGLALNVQLFAGNYLHYGSIAPVTEQVLLLDQAMQYRMTARSYIIRQFREGRITINQAWDMASRITHTKDRLDTIGLVNNYALLRQAGFKPMGLLPYTAEWIYLMLAYSFGIKAHISMPNDGISLLPLVMLILLSGIAVAVRWRPWDLQWLPSCLAVVVAFYSVFLLYRINYAAYLDSWNMGVTVAGRYIFPVIGPIYVLSSLYLMQLFMSRNARLALAMVATVILVGSDFPFFMLNVAPDWYNWAQG